MMLNTRLDSCREPGLLSDQQPIEAVNSGRRLTGETIESAAVGPHPPPVHREMSVASLLSRFDRQLPFILRLGTTLELSDYREKRCKFPNQVTSRRTCLHTHTHTHRGSVISHEHLLPFVWAAAIQPISRLPK